MNVVVNIDGREAIPVRAIPLLSNWKGMTAEDLAYALAGQDKFFQFEGMSAYRWTGDLCKPMRPRDWETIVLQMLAIDDRISDKQVSLEDGRVRFRSKSLRLLPAGTFVWRDEFEPRYLAKYRIPHFSLETGMQTPRSKRADDVALDFDPNIDEAELRQVVMAGFEVLQDQPVGHVLSDAQSQMAYGLDSAASLIVQVAGRDALPVRAIPYVTGRNISPDDVARNLGRIVGAPFALLKNTAAYHLHNGVPTKVLPKEWDLYIARFVGLEAALRSEFADDDQGYDAWLAKVAVLLPKGVFVWFDEFEADFQQDFSEDAISFMRRREGERDLNCSPMIEEDERAMVLAGFQPKDAAPVPAAAAAQVRTIEVAATPPDAPVVAEPENEPPRWTLTKPRRFQGYTEPLYLMLESAYIANKAKPTARDVLREFGANQPSQISKVIEGESLDYYLANGQTKTANLKAIREAIAGMTGKRQDPTG